MYCFALSVQVSKPTINQSVNQFTLYLRNTCSCHYAILQCVTFVFFRVLGMSNFMHNLVSIDIAVMCAVRRSVERLIF
jgi:hypothetical protein